MDRGLRPGVQHHEVILTNLQNDIWNVALCQDVWAYTPFGEGYVRHTTTKVNSLQYFYEEYVPQFFDPDLFDFVGYFSIDAIDEESYMYGFSDNITLSTDTIQTPRLYYFDQQSIQD